MNRKSFRIPFAVVAVWLVVMTASVCHAKVGVGKLLSNLSGSGAARIRAQAALALSSFDHNPAVVKALVRALEDPHVMVRSSAARALMAIAPAEAFADICRIGAQEKEPFALNWIQKAAARSAGASTKVLVNVDGLECVGADNRMMVSQKLRSAFLQKLFAYDGYSIGVSLDFSGDASADEGAGVELDIVGSFTVDGNKQATSGKLDVRAVTTEGFVVWSTVIETLDVVQGKAPEIKDPFADEFTIREEGEDARLVAATEAGTRAATRLNVELRGVE
ncbi:MAG TPA: HEAT repeat domain-containing protein [Myxococcota bacterium]|nr:HEAT repeat domain-containing protein [Myxococcota bacterium]